METGLFDLIKEHVSIFDMLQKYSPESYAVVRSQRVGHKIPCPFAQDRHAKGTDSSPSAKFFPETGSVYCWTCSGSWDVIAFYAEANQMFKKDSSGKTIPDKTGNFQLDYGAAAARLASEYDLDYKAPDWYSRLKKTITVLKQPSRQAPEANKVRDLISIYESKLKRPDNFLQVAAHCHLLPEIPSGSWVGIERDMHQWYEMSSELMDKL